MICPHCGKDTDQPPRSKFDHIPYEDRCRVCGGEGVNRGFGHSRTHVEKCKKCDGSGLNEEARARKLGKDFKENFQQRLAAEATKRIKRQSADPPPRYDEMFYEGVEYFNTSSEEKKT